MIFLAVGNLSFLFIFINNLELLNVNKMLIHFKPNINKNLQFFNIIIEI